MPSVMGPIALTNPFMINETVPLYNIEIWTLRNQTPIAHPFHIHNVPFYILDINGIAPPPELSGPKDVILVPGGNGVVRFITRFEDFSNDSIPYMYHCHMLSHEDDGMMGQFLVKKKETIEPPAPVDSNLLYVYPNPTAGIIQFSDHPLLKSDYQLEIFDASGRLMRREKKINGNRSADLSSFAAGIYWIRLNVGSDSRVLKLLKY
jgi:blue copper oxidase